MKALTTSHVILDEKAHGPGELVEVDAQTFENLARDGRLTLAPSEERPSLPASEIGSEEGHSAAEELRARAAVEAQGENAANPADFADAPATPVADAAKPKAAPRKKKAAADKKPAAQATA